MNVEEITPRELKPALLALDGISRVSVEAHYRLYQGYVNKRNEILTKLGEVDPAAANQVYSEFRALKVDLSFAIGGIKNHELYFDHLGGTGGDPDGAIGELIRRDFGSAAEWRADLKATGMAGRGWAWTAYDWDADDGRPAVDARACAPHRVVILEGVYSARPELADLLHLRVLLDTPAEIREARLLEREGEHRRGDWPARWSSAEDHYFAALMRPEAFDVVIGA